VKDDYLEEKFCGYRFVTGRCCDNWSELSELFKKMYIPLKDLRKLLCDECGWRMNNKKIWIVFEEFDDDSAGYFLLFRGAFLSKDLAEKGKEIIDEWFGYPNSVIKEFKLNVLVFEDKEYNLEKDE